jgi:hypothetical protein
VENSWQAPRGPFLDQLKQSKPNINFETLAQFPFEIAMLENRGTKQPRPVSAHSPVPGMLESKIPMEQIAPALEKVVLNSLHHASASDAPLLAWPLACGSVVAERTRALEFSNGVLRVEVPDAGWRAELQRLAHRYVASLNRYDVGPVQRIHFVVRKEDATLSSEW